MSSTSRRRFFAIVVLSLLLLFAGFLWVRPLLNIGAGYAAKHACSCHYLQGRGLDEIRAHDLNFSVLGMTQLSPGKNEVRASFFGLVPRRAVYRPGVGCTLINDDLLPLAAYGKGVGAKPAVRSDSVLPPTTLPQLKAAVGLAMRPVPGGGAHAVVILQNGRIVGERYAEGFTKDTPLLGWSMTKSLTGMAWGSYRPPGPGQTNEEVIDELVNRDNLYDEWATDARANVEVGELLRMHSGLGWNEAYGSLSDATIMLHEHADMSAYAAGMPALEPPAEAWVYSSGTTNVLVDLLERDLPSGKRIESLLETLYGRVAPTLLIEPDQSGSPVGSSYGWATARDWARLGQFMLQGGVWEGDTLLQPGWVDYMREPATGSDGSYGAQLWLKGPDTPALPDDAFMMRGFQDQRVIVIPSHQVVIARLGHNDDKQADFNALIEAVLRALPEAKGSSSLRR